MGSGGSQAKGIFLAETKPGYPRTLLRHFVRQVVRVNGEKILGGCGTQDAGGQGAAVWGRRCLQTVGGRGIAPGVSSSRGCCLRHLAPRRPLLRYGTRLDLEVVVVFGVEELVDFVLFNGALGGCLVDGRDLDRHGG